MKSEDWVDVNVGRISREKVANIARELRQLWSGMDNVWPQGDRNRRAQLRVTLDRFQQYHVYLNQQALLFIVMKCKDIPNPVSKQATADSVCPPEVPDFLRWEPKAQPTGSTPESTA